MAERVVCVEFGDPGRLRIVDEEPPDPGPGQVLVATDAIGVSFVDGLIVRGAYQVRPPLPFTPGSALAGRIVAVGPGVDEGRAGERVAGLAPGFGAYASHVVLPAVSAVPLPSGVEPTVAASALESYATLVFAVTRRVT